MTQRVQIVRMRHDAKRWEFVAHGAAFDRPNAEEMAQLIKSHGDKVRFLPIGKE